MQDIFSSPNISTTDAHYHHDHHILSGSFRSLSLFLLSFSPLHKTLSLVHRVDDTTFGFGPHQYLATMTTRGGSNRVYTTSWAYPPLLSSWEVEDGGRRRVVHINNVPITATSSYITIPPPYTHAYSVGGPTGEIHHLDPETGALGSKIQQILFVNPDQLEDADKTRSALRYGSHGIEFSPSGHAFVPVLGTDTIEMYTRDIKTGLLTHLSSVPSPRLHGHDGPRHVKVHPNGKVLYCVTEHTNLVDAYIIDSVGNTLTYVGTRSLVPSSIPPSSIGLFRGDTLMLSPPTASQPTPLTLFATTRGSTPSQRGWLSMFKLDENGMFTFDDGYYYWETPTSGGKANAIDVLAKEDTREGVWLVLSDDDEVGGGGVKVLEWDGWGEEVRVVASWPEVKGASHAIWLD